MATEMETERGEFSISELAREFDVTPRAIRFYEDHGPARAATRAASGASTRRATAPG